MEQQAMSEALQRIWIDVLNAMVDGRIPIKDAERVKAALDRVGELVLEPDALGAYLSRFPPVGVRFRAEVQRPVAAETSQTSASGSHLAI